MSLRTRLLALGIVLAAATPAAFAQFSGSSATYESPVQWHVMGGLNVPVGSGSHLLDTGWNFGFGATFRQPGAPFGLRLDFGYSANNVTSHGLYEVAGTSALHIDGGWVDVWSAAADGELRFPIAPTADGYGLAGVGLYHTSLQLTEFGFGYVCNPWWGYCYLASGNTVVASRSSTEFGWNVGAGVNFKLNPGMTLFVEARYTWINAAHPRIEYVPILFGVRF